MNAVAPHEILSSRLLNHPREQVFEAFSDPARLTLWFGPAGFTSTFETFDFRPGGEWVFVFHGPNGVDHPNRSRFVEVVRPACIVYDHVVPPRFRMTMTLEEEAGGTRLTWRMAFEAASLCEALKGVCVPANEENFDRLEAQLSRS